MLRLKLEGNGLRRVASVGLGVVLLLLTGFAVWAAASIAVAVHRAEDSGVLAQGYEDARSAIASEDFWVTEYLLELGPLADHVETGEIRARHRKAADALVAALATVRETGTDEDRALTRVVLAEHRRYIRATAGLFAAVDAGDAERAIELEVDAIDPLFAGIEEEVDAASARYRIEAAESLESLEAFEDLLLVSTPVVFALGLLLFGFFWFVLRAYARRAEEAREAEVAQLEREAEAVARQNERLREIDRMKDTFIATVSHELRTPLTSIRGYLELLREEEVGEPKEEQRRFLAIVDRNSERLLRVVGDLLFVAQAEAGQVTLERGEVELAALAREAVLSAHPNAREKGIELLLEAELVPPIAGDAPRLAQLLDNLVSNAVKFTPAGGRVSVRAFARDGHAVLEVTDTGMGIPTAEQGRLFEPFFRTEGASANAIQGTGLGLPIAKAIAEGHGGSIAVESEDGKGATFRVELPLAEPTSTLEREPLEVA
ncbi:MAG: sensor histidine kinase [Gaiellaceae bacterium]